MNWKTTLPDDDELVLLRLDDEEYPIALGFRDAGAWREQDASRITRRVIGWMHLHEAAAKLDHER